MSRAPGAAIGPYTLRAELGHGGMGVVYTAHDPRLDRQVAIKVLPPDLTRDETAKQRFLQEAKAASALDHPNICTISSMVPLRDRCNFGRSSWLISQALSVTYVPGEHRLYLERSCRSPENPATADSGMARGLPVPKGLNSRQQFGPAVERRRKSRPRSTGFHGSSPCKCQRLSTLRSSWLPPSRPPTKSGAAQAAVD